MIGPLLKAQAVAFLTRKLLESRVFVAGVQATHQKIADLQEGAYQALLKATEEQHLPTPPKSAQPKPNESLDERNKELLDFIERTKKELEEHKKR